MKHDLRLISMEEIQAEEVKWLWYPYLPRGKLTIVQGDPGEGKTTFVLAVIASLTCGEALPEAEQALEPINVIYQTAEDGLADTIKPRLEAAGADCSRVLVIDESQRELTLSDERLEQAVHQTGAQLIVLDPIQAYLGNDVDMHRANEVRPVLKRVAAMAERTGCAVILIGHMNKAQGLKAGYRGLVIEAFGLGGLHYIRRNLVEKLRALRQRGILVLVVTQCMYEKADLSIYEVGNQLLSVDVISGRDMTTEAAVTKMMWALSLDNPAQVLSENLCGEFR